MITKTSISPKYLLNYICIKLIGLYIDSVWTIAPNQYLKSLQVDRLEG